MMFSFIRLKDWALAGAVLLAGISGLHAQDEGEEWRTWTSPDGAQIEAALKEVLPDGIVIVRRDGKEFRAPLERFSEEDRVFVAEWVRQQQPSAEEFRAFDFSEIDLPQSHDIDDVPHVRRGNREPREIASVKMVLDFHNIEYDAGLSEGIQLREGRPESLIPPADLLNALQGLPIETEFVRREERNGDGDPAAALNAIKKAISLDLPVIVGHRPELDEDTPEFAVVAVGYDSRNLKVLDPDGSRKSIRLDLRDLEEGFVHGVVIFPVFEEPGSAAEEPGQPGTEFLSRVSAAIRAVSDFEPEALLDSLEEKGIEATLRDVNRSASRDQLGRTRSFARQGGIPEIERALASGRIVVTPQEYDAGTGFILVYGGEGQDFDAVEFFPDRTFNRGQVSRGDLANRWITREDRTYRLDLIEIIVPPEASKTSPPSRG